MRLAVLGTGIMGAPMARNLLRAGHEVRIWNRTAAKAEALASDGAEPAPTPAEALPDAEAVLTMVSDADALEQTMIDSGALEAMPSRAIWIRTSTVGLLARLAEERGVAFVDAPVLGTKMPAEEGQLVVVASGHEEVQPRCEPVLQAIARKLFWLGEADMGTRLPLAQTALRRFERALELGHGDEDMIAVYHASVLTSPVSGS